MCSLLFVKIKIILAFFSEFVILILSFLCIYDSFMAFQMWLVDGVILHEGVFMSIFDEGEESTRKCAIFLPFFERRRSFVRITEADI